MQRMRQGLSAIGPTPAERRVDEGGPAPDLAGAFVPSAEMLPGSGFVTGVKKGGTEGGIDFLAELLGITTGAIGSVAGPPGAAIGYMGGKGAVKGLRSLFKPAKPLDVGKLKKATEKVTSFTTSRGKNPSVYTWDGISTQRIHRSPDAHSDKTTAAQPKSGRTIFLDKPNAETVRKFFSSYGEDISILPVSKDKAKIIRNKDYGPKKAGEVAKITFSPQPKEGFHPFEMASNRSRPGEDMRFSVSTDESGKKVLVGQHMGTPITKIEKTTITNKNKGGSVIERNPYNYPSRSI